MAPKIKENQRVDWDNIFESAYYQASKHKLGVSNCEGCGHDVFCYNDDNLMTQEVKAKDIPLLISESSITPLINCCKCGKRKVVL